MGWYLSAHHSRDSGGKTTVKNRDFSIFFVPAQLGGSRYFLPCNTHSGSGNWPFHHLWYGGWRTVISATSSAKIMTSVQERHSPHHLPAGSLSSRIHQNSTLKASKIYVIFFQSERLGKPVPQEQNDGGKLEHRCVIMDNKHDHGLWWKTANWIDKYKCHRSRYFFTKQRKKKEYSS